MQTNRHRLALLVAGGFRMDHRRLHPSLPDAHRDARHQSRPHGLLLHGWLWRAGDPCRAFGWRASSRIWQQHVVSFHHSFTFRRNLIVTFFLAAGCRFTSRLCGGSSHQSPPCRLSTSWFSSSPSRLLSHSKITFSASEI